MMKPLLYLLLLFFSITAQAAEVTYRLDSYNADAGDFVIKAFGEQPEGAVVWYDSKFGATTGNRFNQIPRNNKASFWLSGWEGCTIKSVTLFMCSNNKEGSFALIVKDGEQTLANYPVRDFNDTQWYGQWVSKDLNVYVDLSKDMQTLSSVKNDVEICVKGGTSEGSVYLKAITISYEPAPAMKTESPMGYVYEKLEKKSTLAEGDVVMLYRSGNAAGDIDGIETSGYLDVIGITSTTNVCEYDVEKFTLGKDATGSHWTMTDQYGRTLGAKSQKLCFDDGEKAWDITLGYDGATIANVKTTNGTIRYNTPSGSYARFALYTSKSLALPYLYRQVRQNEPVVSTSIQLGEAERTVDISKQDTVVVKAKLLPTTATDFRISWKSDNEEVATVRDGIINLNKVGDAVITATAKDSGVEESLTLHVVDEAATSINATDNKTECSTLYNINGTLMKGKGIAVGKGKKFVVR